MSAYTQILALPDDGYTAICPRCSLRYKFNSNLINREREIDIIKCRTCQAHIARIAELERNRLMKPRGLYAKGKNRVAPFVK